MGTKFEIDNEGATHLLASTADPSSTAAGTMYYNTADSKLKVSDGSTFLEVGAGAGTPVYDDLQNSSIDATKWTTASVTETDGVLTWLRQRTANASDITFSLITDLDLSAQGYTQATTLIAGVVADGGSGITSTFPRVLIELTDGTNTQTILQYVADNGGTAVNMSFSLALRLTFSANNVNIQRTLYSSTSGSAGGSYVKTEIADNTNVDVTSWSSVKIRITGGSGNFQSGDTLKLTEGNMSPIIFNTP